LRPKALAKTVVSKGLTDENAIQLLVRWIRYAHYRNHATWQEFNTYLEVLARDEHLFEAQCRILCHFGYVTIVILSDQAEKLVGQLRLTQALTNVMNVDPRIGVNLFFVLESVCREHEPVGAMQITTCGRVVGGARDDDTRS